MAMNIDSLERALKKAFGAKLNFTVHRDAETIEILWGGFDNFRNPAGEDSLRVLLILCNSGEYLEIAAPQIYDASDCRHVGALYRVLLGTSMRTNVVQFSLDEADGEIRASAEVLLMDGTCTPKQLHATIWVLKKVIDEYHPHIVRAMENGEISYPDDGTIVRPTLEDSESEDGPLGNVDIDAEIRKALEKTREAGKKMWESAAPARDPGRHA